MSKLTLVGLPLGNIEDISLRAIKVLFSSDIILAEDTRNYLKVKSIIKERYTSLLNILNINIEARPELISYREQNHDKMIPKIIKLLKDGKQLSFMSDAGMPSISDPGFRLVYEVIKESFEVDVIPGPTALETALVISGLPTDKFSFLGFLPRQESKIKKLIISFKELDITLIFYESPFRIIKTLNSIDKNFPGMRIVLCNDLTKKFQRIFRGKSSDLIKELSMITLKGEWVIVLH